MLKKKRETETLRAYRCTAFEGPRLFAGSFFVSWVGGVVLFGTTAVRWPTRYQCTTVPYSTYGQYLLGTKNSAAIGSSGRPDTDTAI